MLRQKGDDGGGLSEDQAISMASLASLSGGLLFLSDDLATLSEARLDIARCLFPPLNIGGRVTGQGDGECPETLVEEMEGPEGSWTLVGLFNWTERVDARAIPLENIRCAPSSGELVHSFDFWSKNTSRGWASTICAPSIRPHSCVVLAVRRRKFDEACFLGSDLHISCGKEVTR